MKKKILLTGATSGIGLETAKILAKEGHHLLLHGRNRAMLEPLQSQLLVINPSISIWLYEADLSSLSDVKSMAEEIIKSHVKLDVIINNAGVLISPQETNVDGYDMRFIVNTIAPYLLTKMLIASLNPAARIVNLSSAAQMPIDWDIFIHGGALEAHTAYAQSKLGITMWSINMAQELEGRAIVIAVNPKSFLGSKMVKKAYGHEGYDLRIGADILYRAALSDEFKNANGKYYDNDLGKFAQPHPSALIRDQQSKLIYAMDHIIQASLEHL